jgi:hypothetical protein
MGYVTSYFQQKTWWKSLEVSIKNPHDVQQNMMKFNW